MKLVKLKKVNFSCNDGDDDHDYDDTTTYGEEW